MDLNTLALKARRATGDGGGGGRGLAVADLGLDGGLAPAAAQVEHHLHRLRRRVVAMSIASSQMRRGSRCKEQNGGLRLGQGGAP